MSRGYLFFGGDEVLCEGLAYPLLAIVSHETADICGKGMMRIWNRNEMGKEAGNPILYL